MYWKMAITTGLWIQPVQTKSFLMFSIPLGKRKSPVSEVVFDPFKPDTSFCVIGDIHGRIDLLMRLVGSLPEDMSIICVGDLIDRGDDSKDVLDYLFQNNRITALMGNHEQLLLNFLISPEKQGRRWLRNGGLQTLASFGISGVTESSGGKALVRARDHLFKMMGEGMVTWLAGLECMAWSGNVIVVHAGADPHIPLDEHDPDTFIWGHPDFSEVSRTDGFWIVHGHTIVDKPTIQDGRISIDTGAYATGKLTAAIVTPSGVEFVST
jgi:serine/threonine protein phosphatase 1